MKAIRISRYASKLLLSEIPIPALSQNSLIIKTNYSPINPSDIYYSKGVYGLVKPKPPLTLGFEGCGIVVDTTENNKKWLNKKVCYMKNNIDVSGSWAEYISLEPISCIALEDNVELKDFACGFVNPMTAYAFLEIIKKEKHKGVVLTAAASAVGKMIIRIYKKEGINCIGIVRRNEKIIENELGIIILNSEDKDFEDKLSLEMERKKVSCFLDCVGGDLCGKVFNKLITGGVCYSYGVFSLKKIQGIDPSHLVFGGKQLKGFWLSDWLPEKSLKEIEEIKENLPKLLKNELKSSISKIYKKEDFEEAIKYYESNMGKGKVLLDFS